MSSIVCMSSVKPNITPKFNSSKQKPRSIKAVPNTYFTKAERVNGRVAMLGFTSAMITELVSGMNIFDQFMQNIPLAVMASGLVTVGTASNPKDEGFVWAGFNPEAELLNGRAAMIGIVALMLTEYVNNTPVF